MGTIDKESCELCNGNGYIHSNNQKGNDETQKCDDCKIFSNDLEAQSFYTNNKTLKINIMNILDKLTELDKATNYNLDLPYYYSDGISFDDFLESVTDSIYEAEVIYYSKAMKILSEHDNSLTESLEIAWEQGFEITNISSELLATLILQNRMFESLADITDEIEQIFNDLN